MTLPTDKELRKAWLKKRFSSWEYHEEMLKIYDEYLSALHRHWDRPEIQQAYPSIYRSMRSPIFYNFDKISKPGTSSPDSWEPGISQGWANSIKYNFNRSDEEFDSTSSPLQGMTEEERKEIMPKEAKIMEMADNITTTANNGWFYPKDGTDDYILDEEYTGPIDWPANWREQVLGSHASDLDSHKVIKVKAGEQVQIAGSYRALDPEEKTQYAQVGDVLPDLHSAYGITVWTRIGD